MEEELNEHDLEERLYAMLHHVDETEGNLTPDRGEGLNILENVPRSTVRRYWRISEPPTPSQKVNVQKDATPTPSNNINNKQQPNDVIQNNQTPKPKEEKRESPPRPLTADLSIFKSPVPQNMKRTIEFIEDEDDNAVILESSDEDEVIEVALPPKPTITIESSDEDELQIVNTVSPAKTQVNVDKITTSGERDISASPAPSAVSSVSDEFIRGDCIALNISSRHQDNPSFDFSLHGSDLLEQSTPSKKKKKKKSKDAVTSTPVLPVTPSKPTPNDGCFATPKGKVKNKKQKSKLYSVTEKSIPSADVYDSDSNQSVDTNKNSHSYIVTDKSLPSTDVYESDSNLSECMKEITPITKLKNTDVESSDSSISQDKPIDQASKKNESSVIDMSATISVVDLTGNDSFVNLDLSELDSDLVMGNVSGFSEYDYYGDETLSDNNISKFGSTKIPSILNENLDFDNLKGNEKVCKQRRYSLTTLRAEMEKFYNESWGGENFNHREIQKSMSRDKDLWAIDPKDRMPSLQKRKVTCNYCNRPGHRDDTCRLKPPICYMCGSTGHFEPRCPKKICLNCGSPNHMYSSRCRNCTNWGNLKCNECGQPGHPATHCPDIWRRYHNTVDTNPHLDRSKQKNVSQMYCSGCSRRGHHVHTCRSYLPFSGLPINSPYVYSYRPVYQPAGDNTQRPQHITPPVTPHRNERNKRQSKSPTTHDTHFNKKRNLSTGDEPERRVTKSPAPQRKTSVSKETSDEGNKKEPNKNTQNENKQAPVEKAPNFIPIHSANHDKKGNMIQDNEVSDTSHIITSARIYVTNDIVEKLNTEEGKAWLKEATEKHSVQMENSDVSSFLAIKGKLADQEAFQAALRDWFKPVPTTPVSADTTKPSAEGDTWSVIPKNRNSLLRQLNYALNSLKEDIGDPSAIYKELTFLQNRHQQLLKQKVISPKQLSNNRGNINQMLKKLNMVLIGQAGLADGSAHVSELYALQEKLMNLRQKVIPNDLRKEIGQHYALIFTALPRNDYSDLLKIYNTTKPSSMVKRKKTLKLNPKLNRLKIKVNSIPTQPIQNGNKEERVEVPGSCCNPVMLQKLAFYHKRLLSARPSGAALKRTRGDLVRRLYSSIASLYRKEKMSSKNMKKVKKLQEQAQLFLSNV